MPFQSQINSDPQKYIFSNNCTLKDLLEHQDFDEDCPASEYYTPSEFSQLSLNNSNLFIHLNISSLSYYTDELNLLLSQMKHRPNITAISDHLTQFVAIPGDWHTEIKNQEIYRRNYKNLNSDKLKKKKKN